MGKKMTLVESWNACDDDELSAFIRLLSYLDALKFTLDGFGSRVTEEERRRKAFATRLTAIVKDKLFQVLISDESFVAAYEWLDTAHAPSAYKTTENKIKLLECIVISFTIYARHIGGKKPLPLNKKLNKATKQINKKAKALLEAIQKYGNLLDYSLKRCCDDSSSRIGYMAEYKFIKPSRHDDTYDEKTFLQEFVTWLSRYNLPRSPKFIGLILQMLGDHLFRPDKRNLIAHIKTCEKRYAKALKKAQQGWE